MKPLDQLLQEHFGVKNVFRKKDGEFTSAVARAYKKLTEILYDVAGLTDSLDEINDIIETLDEITHENY
jgi:hypothetical protein